MPHWNWGFAKNLCGFRGYESKKYPTRRKDRFWCTYSRTMGFSFCVHMYPMHRLEIWAQNNKKKPLAQEFYQLRHEKVLMEFEHFLFAVTKFIRIGIADKNDNPPYFDKALYEAEVDENEDIQHTVLTVTAKDHDECTYLKNVCWWSETMNAFN